MATSKKPAAKSAAKATMVKNHLSILKLESNVPLPERGIRDPQFVQEASQIIKSMKVSQSFVVPKHKLHSVKKLIKNDFENLVVKSALIKPEEKFARIWRVR
jgi:hypothetical protein